MSDTISSRLGLPYLAAGQAQKHVTLNALITRLDGLVQTTVESRSLTQQPAAPADGRIWLLPASPTGADWAGNGGALARYEAGAWSFTPPITGQSLYVRDEQGVVVRSDTDWIGLAPAGGGLFRNRLINGRFGVWQRGASVACPANQTTLTADRWQVWSAGGASTASLTQTGLPVGATAALLISSASGLSSCAASQALESAMIGDLSGQSAVFSAWLYASAQVTPYLNLYAYGAQDQSSTRAFVGSQPLGPVGPGWTRVAAGLALPVSIANGGQIEVGFGAVASGASVGVALAQLEPGLRATPSEHRPITLETALCQRYYQLTAAAYGAVGGWTAANAASLAVSFPVPMRAAPNCVAQGGALTVDCPGVGASTSASVSFSATPTGVKINATGLTPGGQDGRFAGALTPIACSAEL
jgi:hypothetical protein